MKEKTRIIHAGRRPFDHGGVVNTPVYHASTVLHDSIEAYITPPSDPQKVMKYGRRGTPTTFGLQEAMAALEGGDRCLLYPSGAAAISASLLTFLGAGDHFLVADNVYGPTRNMTVKLCARLGIEGTFYDPTIGADIAGLMRPNTRLVFTENPGSLTFEVMDVPAIAAVAHEHGALVAMDNTWATGLLFPAFEHGVDISVQAITKYVCGHSDVMMGAVVVREALFERLFETWTLLGHAAAPDDAYLAARGLRTLSVRLPQHHQNAMVLARWLCERPEVERVLYPPMPDDPGHALWQRDFKGASGLFGVELKPTSQKSVAAMVDDLALFGIGASWGGYESLCIPTYPARFRTATDWSAGGPTLRIHAGLEDTDDLIEDLDAGFARLRAAA